MPGLKNGLTRRKHAATISLRIGILLGRLRIAVLRGAALEDVGIGYLREQVRLIRPRVIGCLGRISAMRLIKPDFRITKEHGEWFEKGNYLMTAVYHPAYLLRDPRKKEDMLNDMKRIRQKLDELRAKED